MQIEELKTFIAVVDSENFTKAARVLKIAQPTVSLHVKNLESTLQTPLLTRTSRSFKVTAAGQLLYERALELIDLADRTKVELTHQQKRLKGPFRIAATPVIAEGILPDVLTRLHAKYPELQVELSAVESHMIADLLRKRKADVGCSDIEELSSANVFMEDELLLVASSNHPLAHKKSSSILDLQSAYWILPSTEDMSRTLIDRSLHQYGVKPNYAIVNSPESIKQSVLSGLGIAFLSRHSCKREIERGELAVLNYKVSPIRRPFYTLTTKQSATTQAFLDELDAYCRLWKP
ncbi:LysR family transcriptional regulator [Sporosarcina sp. GW1-11]|uniref:LysR family transcriptional regulator n=1 Tax=Sporosarcina sp. GW1-11 TaxID=2899126 RepID=UPI00294CC684|nr:LysR family transcriptional regulator [Sporosarcina sp. GW1-11]MDV6379390.1 LysR family transcriptional regulator [Sporosarcina sp. GW1-11]